MARPAGPARAGMAAAARPSLGLRPRDLPTPELPLQDLSFRALPLPDRPAPDRTAPGPTERIRGRRP